jgi:hypothetical protein
MYLSRIGIIPPIVMMCSAGQAPMLASYLSQIPVTMNLNDEVGLVRGYTIFALYAA